MYKYRKDEKGFILIEVLCSILVFIAICTISFKVIISAFKLKTYNENLYYYARFLSEVKNCIIYNDLDIHKEDKEVYIWGKDMKLGILKENNLIDIKKETPPSKPPYLIIKVNKFHENKEEILLSIMLEKENIECNFIRGGSR
ncbi:pilus assembly FimT family protein [Clostridium rectalis]|uniref:pilus assembly FimT family protein n=1 Tax=Clostridium rectalis TaxID=2040295 RepID=UPI000F62C350|nr:hypothetical protein [Clostridium rectalis]